MLATRMAGGLLVRLGGQRLQQRQPSVYLLMQMGHCQPDYIRGGQSVHRKSPSSVLDPAPLLRGEKHRHPLIGRRTGRLR